MPAAVLTEADRLDAQKKERAMGETEQVHDRNLGRQIEYAKTHPMKIVAGPSGPALNGVAQKRAPEDVDLLKKTAHLRAKGESLLAFMARTGISLHQIINYTKRDIDNLYMVAKQNEMPEPKRTPIPDKFKVTIDASGDLDAHLAKNRMPDNIVEVGI
jgi:hypothetical protein